jgi:hypothetical protein
MATAILCLFVMSCACGIFAFVPQTTTRRSHNKPSNRDSVVGIRESSALFGIKGFRQWFEEQFPNAVKRVDVSKHHDTFDHVLVDMNQILHVVVRRSRDEEHAIILLMRELDVLIQRARPSQSLVLAIDGSPSAAKLSTQRKRRFGILKNSNFKLQNLDKMRVSKRERAKRLRSYQSDLQALELTPGTECMQRMEAALLYWAWQRLQSQGRPHSKLLPRVRIYMSSSRVPGEGEIKLLEWVHNFRGSLSRHPGQTIALIGGDADLLLEAMVLPPAWTHNVFVLRPEDAQESKKSTGSGGSSPTRNAKQLRKEAKDTMLCTSLWEMTLSLDEFCRSTLPAEYYHPERDQKLLLQIRNDLVLLMIMNGNDYLPRLVASGFRGLFRCYVTLLKQWIVQHGSIDDAGLIDPNTLKFRLPFCVKFFSILGERAPSDEVRNQSVQKSSRRTYQSIMNNMIAVGFVPGPARFHYISGRHLEEIDDLPPFAEDGLDDDEPDGEEAYYDDDAEDDDDVGEYDFEEDDGDDEFEDSTIIPREEGGVESIGASEMSERLLVRLTLGRQGQEELETHQMWSGQTSREIQKAKGKLSKQVLEKYSLLELLNGDGGIQNKDYSWEIEVTAASNVKRYLAGLVWTLQTYQDGVCPSYGYNYGKCLAPTGRGIEEYFSQAIREKRDVGAQELLQEYHFGGSITAGAACLAALPSSVKNFVPKPYSLIDSETVEGIYAQCMDPSDNFFQMQKFQSLIEEEIKKITGKGKQNTINESHEFLEMDSDGGRRVILGDHYWSVLRRVDTPLQHPFRPPSPPAENFRPMPFNSFIKASRIISMDWPRPRPGWKSLVPEEGSHSLRGASKKFFLESWLSKHNSEVDHMDFGSTISAHQTSLSDIPYKIAFRGSDESRQQTKSKSEKKVPFQPLKATFLDIPHTSFSKQALNGQRKLFNENKNGSSKKSQQKLTNSRDRQKDGRSPRQIVPTRNLEDQTSVTVLKQLNDTGFIKDYKFDEHEKDNEGYEVTLQVIPAGEEVDSFFIRRYVPPLSGEKKKAVQKILASHVLQKIVQEKLEATGSSSELEWHNVSFRDLSCFLNSGSSRPSSNNSTNPENLTALQLLKQLLDTKAIANYVFEEEELDAKGSDCSNVTAPHETATQYTLILSLGPSFNFSFTEIRLPGVSKQATRQQLASSALNYILNSFQQGGEKDRLAAQVQWYELNANAIRNQLMVAQKQ